MHVTDAVTDAEIDQFLSGRLLDVQRHRRIVRHLLSACPFRAGLANTIPYTPLFLDDEESPPPVSAPVEETAYDVALESAFAAVADRAARAKEERIWRDDFLADVHSRGLTTFDEIVDAIPDQMPGRARLEALLTLSFETRYRDPRLMLDLARAAKIVATNLGKADEDDQASYVPTELADLCAQTAAELANAYRRNENFESAEDTLAQAFTWREKGSSDPMLFARLLDVLASLRTDQRRLDEAIGLLERVHALYLEVGQTHFAGRALVSKANAIHYDRRSAEALPIYRQGLTLLDPLQDPRLCATTYHALLDAMVSSGEYRQAKRLLFESRLRHSFATEPLNLLKLDWLEGKIFAGLGQLLKAEQLLATARGGFQHAGLDYEAALIGLELAEVLLRLGRAVELENLACEILETFRILEVAPEALRAVRYLEKAVRERIATTELVRQVLDFLRRLERNPHLQFSL